MFGRNEDRNPERRFKLGKLIFNNQSKNEHSVTGTDVGDDDVRQQSMTSDDYEPVKT